MDCLKKIFKVIAIITVIAGAVAGVYFAVKNERGFFYFLKIFLILPVYC